MIQKINYLLTRKCQLSKKCNDNKKRNFLIYFLNGIQILKQKLPFNVNYESGYDRRTSVSDEYILNGKIYQKRINHIDKERTVSFPLSKNKLIRFKIPKDLKIEILQTIENKTL